MARPRRPWRGLVLAAVGVILLLAAERWVRPWLATQSMPTGRAEWIWPRVLTPWHGPVAFYLVRDLHLGAARRDTADPAPESSPDGVRGSSTGASPRGAGRVPSGPEARLLIVADEEYVVYVNGRRVGSGRYSGEARLDVYEVGPLLRRGRNRVVAEVRSSRGVGGFLASLRVEGPEPLELVTDERWRVAFRYTRGLLFPLGPLKGLKRVRSWGLPPAGRWGRPWLGERLPLFGEVTARAAVRAPLRVRIWGAGREWLPMRDPDRRGRPRSERPPRRPGREGVRRPPERPARWPGRRGADRQRTDAKQRRRVVFDWGEPVTGYLQLAWLGGRARDAEAMAARPGRGLAGPTRDATDDGPGADIVGLVWLGEELPDPREALPSAYLIGVPGRLDWSDSQVRRFRYAVIFATRPLRQARVRVASRIPAVRSVPGALGAFGLPPTILRPPIENEVWRVFEGVPGGAGREGG